MQQMPSTGKQTVAYVKNHPDAKSHELIQFTNLSRQLVAAIFAGPVEIRQGALQGAAILCRQEADILGARLVRPA